MFADSNDTIIACSTGTITDSAIAVLRISGNFSLSNFQPFFSINLDRIKPRVAYFSQLIEEGKIIDEILLTFFPSPNSFNGQNTIELSVHGNQINIQRILSIFVKNKLARHAKEGEFTYRALLNKKLSLSQVEGLDLILNAKSSLVLDSGLQTLHGDIYNDFLDLRNSFLSLKSALEINIDFSDDVGEEESISQLHDAFKNFNSAIIKLNSRKLADRTLLNSPQIVLFGKTNAGKSSLFNQLLGINRAIVSPTHGTTRDFISENLFLDNISFKLIDTAGVRETDCDIEEEGIRRSFNEFASAFFKILVINPEDNTDDIFEKIDLAGVDLFVFTHKDFNQSTELEKVLPSLPEGSSATYISLVGPIEPSFFGPMGAKYDSNNVGPIEPILQMILAKYKNIVKSSAIIVPRHGQVLEEIAQEASRFQQVMIHNFDLGILSSESSIIGTKIQELIGQVAADDVLGHVFANFCIGK